MIALAIIVVALVVIAAGTARFLAPPDDREWKIEVRLRNPSYSTDFPWEAAVYCDGEFRGMGRIAASTWGARISALRHRRRMLKSERRETRYEERGGNVMILRARGVDKVRGSRELRTLRARYARDEITHEEFERQAGRLLLAEDS